MNQKHNQRFRQSAYQIQKAFVDLLETNEHATITVSAICKQAQINRSTFYAHYLDVYDLMGQMEQYLSEELITEYQAHQLSAYTMFSPSYMKIFLSHIKQHQRFYRISLQRKKSFPLEQGFDICWNHIVKPVCLQRGITSESDMMYYFVFYQAGLTIVLKRWVEQGCTESEESLIALLKPCMPSFELI